MACPPEITDIVADILYFGLLKIRTLGWAGNPERCAVEADHLHNLPALLKNFSTDLLSYYMDVERPSYVARSSQVECAVFEPLWQRLEALAHASHSAR